MAGSVFGKAHMGSEIFIGRSFNLRDRDVIFSNYKTCLEYYAQFWSPVSEKLGSHAGGFTRMIENVILPLQG